MGKARYDKANRELADLRLNVHQEYLEAFRRLYRTLGQLVYKKEKRLEDIDRQIRTTHIQLEFSIETFGPTEDALLQAGIEFVHPAEEVEDNNLNRHSKMVEYRAHLAKQEEVKIAAEREELKRVKSIQSQQYRGKPVQQIE